MPAGRANCTLRLAATTMGEIEAMDRARTPFGRARNCARRGDLHTFTAPPGWHSQVAEWCCTAASREPDRFG